MIEIPLTKGGVALIDDDDAALAVHRWTVKSGYAARFTYPVRPAGEPRQQCIRLHRVVLGLAPDDPREGDHINRDKLDNRRSNLRIVAHASNMQNQDARSGFRGVTFIADRGKWAARSRLLYKEHFLGYHSTALRAARAAEAFRRHHMPFAEPDLSLGIVLAPCRCTKCRGLR